MVFDDIGGSRSDLASMAKRANLIITTIATRVKIELLQNDAIKEAIGSAPGDKEELNGHLERALFTQIYDLGGIIIRELTDVRGVVDFAKEVGTHLVERTAENLTRTAFFDPIDGKKPITAATLAEAARKAGDEIGQQLHEKHMKGERVGSGMSL